MGMSFTWGIVLWEATGTIWVSPANGHVPPQCLVLQHYSSISGQSGLALPPRSAGSSCPSGFWGTAHLSPGCWPPTGHCSECSRNHRSSRLHQTNRGIRRVASRCWRGRQGCWHVSMLSCLSAACQDLTLTSTAGLSWSPGMRCSCPWLPGTVSPPPTTASGACP